MIYSIDPKAETKQKENNFIFDVQTFLETYLFIFSALKPTFVYLILNKISKNVKSKLVFSKNVKSK